MLRKPLLLTLLLMLYVTLYAPALRAAEWQVVRVTGLVWVVAVGMEPAQATPGMILPDNATVATTSRARAMLRHGEDILNLGPSTHIAPQTRRVRGLTTVLMRQGELEADIERRARPHFSVQTPFLAAVVKGTRFTVAVSERGAEVSVASGRVEVADLGAGQAVEITNGQRAVTATAGGLAVSGSGALPEIQSVSPRSALVETPAGRSANSAEAQLSIGTAAAPSNAGGLGADARGRGNDNSGANNRGAGNSGNNNAGGNSGGPGNSGNSNAGGNSGGSGNSGNSNAGGNSGGAGNSGNSNAGGGRN